MLLLTFLIIGAGICACLTTGEKAEQKSMLKNRKDISGIYEIPKSYYKRTCNAGRLEEITYDVKLTDGTGRTARKSAMVYIPYAYSKKEKYDVFYLIHGSGGSQHTYLGSRLLPRTFKRILDNMIVNGDIKPTIVVTPTFTKSIRDYYTCLDGISHEVTHELMRKVESEYSTYAKDTTESAFRASRGHRAFGGFSMGGCATWRLLRDHADYAKYFLPISMPIYYVDNGYNQNMSESGADEIVRGVETSGANRRDYMVFASSGTADFMCHGTEMQARDLTKYNEWFKWFNYADENTDDGNITFYAWKDRKHHFYKTYPYLYNGLIRFFR